MSRSPVLFLLVAVQVVASLVFAGLCALWLFRTQEMTQLAVQSNAEMAKVAKLRQGVGALLQDSVAYSERNPAMKTLLGQLGVKVNTPGNPTAAQPNSNRR